MNTLGHAPDIFAYPETRSGKIAVALIALALGAVGFVGATLLLVGGMFASETVIGPGWLAVPLAALALCGTIAAIAAVVAFIVEHERSIFVGLSFLVGLIITHASINGL